MIGTQVEQSGQTRCSLPGVRSSSLALRPETMIGGRWLMFEVRVFRRRLWAVGIAGVVVTGDSS
ncbi:hypothetical protein B446_35573 (plasmid) [Streptomyces collinus Tu 365]|uniref:Uncharacterized protein n=1 Tax=Streptomyces collinus (strain DSM 40733 / Tue 365) TaxID=1214242 RepID=S5V2R9_STRC3|nr:hypothetical protein B446_35573 [Streptomyces collinus Tu 365]